MANLKPQLAALALLVACNAGNADQGSLQATAARYRGTPEESDAAPNVVWVTLDNVRWQDAIEHMTKTMPRTARLVADHGLTLGGRATCGGVLQAGNMGDGRPGHAQAFGAWLPECPGDTCAPADRATVFDEAAAAGLEVASISSREAMAGVVTNGNGHGFVSAGPTPGVGGDPNSEPTRAVSGTESGKPGAWPADYRPDEATITLALRYFRALRPRLFHVGLGDTEAFARTADRRGYLDALERADDLVAQLWAEVGPNAGTQFLITSDQAQGQRVAKARRVWVIAFGDDIPVAGNFCLGADVTLADLAPTVRQLLGIPTATGSDERPIPMLLSERARR